MIQKHFLMDVRIVIVQVCYKHVHNQNDNDIHDHEQVCKKDMKLGHRNPIDIGTIFLGLLTIDYNLLESIHPN